MSAADDMLSDLRFSDVKTFLAVRRCRSITSAASELSVTPSQVSKAIARLEAQLKLRLLTRSAKGVSLSEAAERITPHFEEVAARLRQVVLRIGGDSPELSVAGPSYVLSALLPAVAAAHPELRLRALQLAPTMIRPFTTQSLFDVAFAGDIDRLPSSWMSEHAGDFRKALFTTRATAWKLGKGPVSQDALRDFPFIIPMYLHNDQHVPIDDGCPLAVGDRSIGHAVQTIALGLEMAAASNQFVFGPVIAAGAFLADGRLVEVDVEGWDVRDPLYVVCNADRVAARVLRSIVATIRDTIHTHNRRAA